MKIDNRLKRIADFISDDSYILDVGCDHALLDIYLCLNKKNIKAIASDINELPLIKAKENIEKYNLQDKIKLIHADGLNSINDKVDTIVISGMGSLTINNIVNSSKDKLYNIKKIIISSHTSSSLIRQNMNNLNYKIKDEDVVYDKKKYYEIIVYEKGRKHLSKKEIEYGPILINKNNKEVKDYFKYRYSKLEEISCKITNKKDKKILDKKIKELRKIL